MTEIRFLSEPLQTGFVEEWYAEDHFWMEWRMAAFLRQLRELGAETGKPWTGAARAWYAADWRPRSCWDVDGANVTPPLLSSNQKRRGKILLYNIHDRRAEAAQAYDFVLLFDVVEHIANVPSFLEVALYHLKPGGWLFINVPALQGLKGPYDRAVGHLRRYNKDMMTQELNRHALEIRDIRYWAQP